MELNKIEIKNEKEKNKMHGYMVFDRWTYLSGDDLLVMSTKRFLFHCNTIKIPSTFDWSRRASKDCLLQEKDTTIY
jgi:hypothetical protein